MTTLTKLTINLFVFGLVFYMLSRLFTQFSARPLLTDLVMRIMKMPPMVMTVLMAIPEQLVLASYEPHIPLVNRIMVSVAMYVIHFAYNGYGVMKPVHSYSELAWILGTSYYAYRILGVRQETAVALIAADSVMTLSLRGLA
jgi:hypothetical protein